MLIEIDDSPSLPARSIGLDAMIARRDALKELVTRVSQELATAEAHAVKEGFGSLLLACNGKNGYAMPSLFSGDTAAIMRRIDAEAWRTLLVESGLRTFLNASQRADWDRRLRQGEFPEFTREAIEESFLSLYQRRRDIFEEGVVDLFIHLHPRQSQRRFKTNEGMAFNRRFIIRGISGWNGVTADTGCHYIDDLVRAFCVVSGKPEPDAREGFFHQVQERLREETQGFVLENEWLSLRVHPKAGTGHVTLKATEQVDVLNEIIARRLPMALGHVAMRSGKAA